MMGFGGIGILLIIAVVFIVMKYIPNQQFKTFENKESAIDILKKRFASGEISEKEFEEKKKTIL